MSLTFRNYYGPPRTVAYNPGFPFTLEEWNDPFYDIHRSGHAAVQHHAFPTSFANTEVEWDETPEAVVCKVHLPAGFNKHDVSVDITQNGRLLTITGEKEIKNEERGETWHRVECGSGKFVRSFRLPENTRADRTRKHVENGMLTLTIPKKEMNRHHRSTRTIDIHYY